MRKWEKYLNKQLYSECQLVTAINAYYFFTGKTIKQDSKEYGDLVDLCGARHGSAICIEKVHKKLGLTTIGYSEYLSTSFENQWLSLRQINKCKKGIFPKKYKKPKARKGKIELPLELTIWHKKTGFHSVLIVDHCLKTECFQIVNFRHETTVKGWLFIENLYMYMNTMNKGWCFRLFGRRKYDNLL